MVIFNCSPVSLLSESDRREIELAIENKPIWAVNASISSGWWWWQRIRRVSGRQLSSVDGGRRCRSSVVVGPRRRRSSSVVGCRLSSPVVVIGRRRASPSLVGLLFKLFVHLGVACPREIEILQAVPPRSS